MQTSFFIEQAISLGLDTTENVVTAPYTTFKIGGRADILIVANSISEVYSSVKLCNANEMKYKILGGGSNILISDNGFRGVIIINKSDNIEIIESASQLSESKNNKSVVRFASTNKPQTLEKNKEKIIVRVASGVKIPRLINTLWTKNISGLELFAGIPATVGGAVYMNMHGANHFFGDLLLYATLFDGNETKTVSNSYFQFDYDYSILHETRETILSCDLLLNKGSVSESKEITKDWLRKKRIQPQRSAGCIFQNITADTQQKLQLPTPSVGYIIDKVLQMKGYAVGGAKISESHAAFIENTGNATAKDVLELISTVKKEAYNKMSIQLETEIEFIE